MLECTRYKYTHSIHGTYFNSCECSQVLDLLNHAIVSGIPFDAPENALDTPQARQTLRKAAADSIVLLKNKEALLPLKTTIKKIAVIGPNAKYAVVSGGGSASLRSTYTVSPLEGITEAATGINASVTYAVGALSHKYLPLIDPYITYDGNPGALFEFWNKSPTDDYLKADSDLSSGLPTAVWKTSTYTGNCFLADGVVSDFFRLVSLQLLTSDRPRIMTKSMRSAGSGYGVIDRQLYGDIDRVAVHYDLYPR